MDNISNFINYYVESKVKLSELEAEEKGVLKNLIIDLESRLDYKSKEKEHASLDRLKTLDRQIEEIKIDIEDIRKENAKKYDQKKKNVYLDLLEKIFQTMESLSEGYIEKINNDELKLRDLKSLIIESNENNNFDEVIKYSNEAYNINSNLSNKKNLNDDLSTLMEKVSETINNNDKLNYVSLSAILDDYELKLLEIDRMFNSDIKPLKKEKPKVHDKLDDAIKALEKAKETLNEDDLEAAVNLINELPDSEEKNDLQAECAEIDLAIKAKNKSKGAIEALEKAKETLNEDDLEAAVNLINELPDSEEKNDLQAECAEIDLVIKANKSLEIAESTLDKNAWSEAKRLIENLPDGDAKDSLTERYEALVNSNKSLFETLLSELESEVANQRSYDTNEILDVNKVMQLSNRWNLLEETDKNSYEQRVREIILVRNANVQHQRKLAIADEKVKKIGLKERILEGVAWVVNGIFRTKKWGKHILKRVNKFEAKGNNEKAAKKKESYYERDHAYGVKLFSSINNLNKLKPKLYKNGKSSLKTKQLNKYIDATRTLNQKLYSINGKMIKKEKEEILSDPVRIRNIMKQYMDMLSVSDENAEEFQIDVNIVKGFLEDVSNSNTLDAAEVLAYQEEIDNIVFYKNEYPSNVQYEYKDSDIKDISEKDNSELPYIKKFN